MPAPQNVGECGKKGNLIVDIPVWSWTAFRRSIYRSSSVFNRRKIEEFSFYPKDAMGLHQNQPLIPRSPLL